uniref:Ankyrin repeat protein n=2 Tax=Hemiselmis andersenii TaxID=464988 RepID=A0A7S0TU17_HEMAN
MPSRGEAEGGVQKEKKKLPDDVILTPCYRGDVDRVKELLSGKFGKVDVHACDALGNTGLHLAAFNGHLEVMTLLIQGGADPNVVNGEKDTALYMAVLSNDIECVKCIAECDVEFNCTNIEGFTPLHYAAGEGNLQIVRYLVENCEAETEIPDNLGLTPGFCAVLQGRHEVSEYLLSSNPDGVHARNMSSDTMLHCALKANAPKALVKLLIDHGADLSAVGADNIPCDQMLQARGHHDLIERADASRASTPSQQKKEAPAARPTGPAQIPWMKKYISCYIDTGSAIPNKPTFKDANFGDEFESHLVTAS